MAVAIRSLNRKRRTAQRGKPMSQSQRWGKVVIIMPVPEGVITTTELWEQPEPNQLVEEALPEVEDED